MTGRDYVPLPLEYLETMELLSDEDFGKLCRALIRYASAGEEIALEGDARFFCKLVMIKDDFYSQKFDEEQKKARSRREHAARAATARYEKAEACPSMPGQTISSQVNSPQVNSPQFTSTEEPSEAQAEPCAPETAITLTLSSGESYAVEEKDMARWAEAYPAVDIRQELLRMRSWFDANPRRRRTRGTVGRFIVAWLAKEQDRGGRSPYAQKLPDPGKPRFAPLMEG